MNLLEVMPPILHLQTFSADQGALCHSRQNHCFVFLNQYLQIVSDRALYKPPNNDFQQQLFEIKTEKCFPQMLFFGTKSNIFKAIKNCSLHPIKCFILIINPSMILLFLVTFLITLVTRVYEILQFCHTISLNWIHIF